MGTFINAVKNLINSLTAKTSSTASTADMVQLHDANGNPNGKISLADLASVLGGIQGFTWLPANYTGLINDLKAPGFVYFQRRDDDDNIPYKGNASSWIWCITLGRGDLTQIAWSNSWVVREIYFRRGGKTSSVGWSNGESWKKINLEALT